MKLQKKDEKITLFDENTGLLFYNGTISRKAKIFCGSERLFLSTTFEFSLTITNLLFFSGNISDLITNEK